MREDTSVCDTPRPCRASPPLRLTERGLGGEVSPLHLAAAAACFALGWWTKQTFIMVPLAALAVLLWSRSRVAVALGGMYAAFVGIPAAVFTLATGGGFAQKIIGYQGSWEWVAFRRLAEPFASRYGAWLLLAAVAAVAFTLRRRGPTFAAVWFALAGVAALAAGTSGGNHNHFVELLAAAALLVGQGVAGGLHTGTANGRGGRRGVAAIAVVVLLTGVSVAENEGPRGWLAREYTAPTVAQEAGYRAVADYLANTSGPVYSDNVGILVVARQPVRVTDPFTMAAAVRLGRWDDAQLVADVAAGRFAAIALRYDTLDPDRPPTDATPALIRAIEGRYRLAERNILYVYVPK